MTAEATDFYTGDDYAEKHPTWHDEYCAGKAGEIVKLLRRNNLHPRRIVDVGCGAGGVILSYPLIFSRAKMQLEVGASLRRFSHDES